MSARKSKEDNTYRDGISGASKELQRIVGLLNDKYFGSELPNIPIFVTPNTKKISCFNPGSVTVYHKKDVKTGHINVSDHILSLPIENVCSTLLHDMCHHYCYINGVKDTSRGYQYHNRRFKNVAITHGLNVARNNACGWEITSPSSDLLSWVSQNFDRNYSLEIFRYTRSSGKSPGNSVRYVCPVCGSIARKTDRKRIGCWECNIEMICTTPLAEAAC